MAIYNKLESPRFHTVHDQPLLIFQVGVLGCGPLDLLGELADEYEAAYISSAEAQLDLMAKSERNAKSAPVDAPPIQRILLREAATALHEGRDVVIDGLFNTIESRRAPIRLAQSNNATSIAIWPKTTYGLAKQRVEAWTEQGEFLIPAEQQAILPIVAAKRMMRDIESPSTDEGIDLVLKFNGEYSTRKILDDYETRLTKFGLMARYEEVPA